MKLSPEEQAVLETDYPRSEVSRAEAARYRLIHRGSARLAMDLYRTEEEHRAFLDKGLRTKLPGQR